MHFITMQHNWYVYRLNLHHMTESKVLEPQSQKRVQNPGTKQAKTRGVREMRALWKVSFDEEVWRGMTDVMTEIISHT